MSRDIKIKYMWQHEETGRFIERVYSLGELEKSNPYRNRDGHVFLGVGLYTGLKDRKGVEIYEGSVIEVIGGVSGRKLITVEDVAAMELSALYPAGLVVGNIYQNPDIVGAKEVACE